MLQGNFQFLNSERHLGWPPKWDPDDVPRLWLFNLHYFDFIWNLDYEDARDVTQSWLDRAGSMKSDVLPEPYPASVRLINWVGVFFCRFAEETQSDQGFLAALWAEMAAQAEWLKRHLEYRIMGNHLLENATALLLLGTFFDGPTAQGWRQTGATVLEHEVPTQVLADGMHYERSPMYHLRVLYLLILVAACGEGVAADVARQLVPAMLPPTILMTHPDGEIALFNDSAMSVYHKPGDLVRAAEIALGMHPLDPVLGAWKLPEAGYYGYREANGTYIVVDAGEVAPANVPAHAHADIFSFELSLRGHRIIVDAGVHDYEQGETRDYCRSTRAHNTVEVESEDQCEFWSTFRMARRASPHDVSWHATDKGFTLTGSHDGYTRLKGRPIHHRSLKWETGRGLHMVDRVRSRRPVQVVSRIHLHPECEVTAICDASAEVSTPGGAVTIRYTGPGALSLEDSFYCPKFGSMQKSVALAYSVTSTMSETTTEVCLA